MAGSLFLDDPEAYAGLVMIGGPFATDDLPSAALSGKPVLFCRGKHDEVIPPNKFDQAEAYLRSLSGADATLISYDGGHEVTPGLICMIGRWFTTCQR
jgi:phospholipase/carboxylesterase